MKSIIFNADDLGISELTDLGILKCVRSGIVKSASLMVNSSLSEKSYRLAKEENVSIGIHLNATSLNDFLTDKKYLFGKTGKIKSAISGRGKLSDGDLINMIEEFKRQLDLFEKLFNEPPDHINHHHPLYFIDGFTEIFKSWIEGAGIPCRWSRDLGKINLKHPDYTEFGFYERDSLNVQSLIRMIEKFPEGVTEVMVHPGLIDNSMDSVYKTEREIQVEVLTDSVFRDYLHINNLLITDFRYFKNV